MRNDRRICEARGPSGSGAARAAPRGRRCPASSATAGSSSATRSASWPRLRDHGDVVRLRLGPKTVYAVTAPDLTGAMALSTDYIIGGPLWESLEGLLGKEGVATANGPTHRRQRRTIQPAFRLDAIPAYGPIMEEEAHALDRALEARRDRRLHRGVLPDRRAHRGPLSAARRLHGRARRAAGARSPPSSGACTGGW